jgi:hypothetical protein
MIAGVSWNNGPVFETDSDNIVDWMLEGSDVQQFFEPRTIPDNAQLLLELGAVLDAERVRLDLEEIGDDRLIEHFAKHPEQHLDRCNLRASGPRAQREARRLPAKP